MMDAGMRLFETEKPFGTVVGGIKNETSKYGKVLRAKDMEGIELPAASVGCDLFLNRSTKYKTKYISCTIEDAGEVGTTSDGEQIRRYARGWKVGRISKTALAVLRTALCEILYMDDIPNAAAINEAVELAKGYDEPDTVSFVNGVLGGFMRRESEN